VTVWKLLILRDWKLYAVGRCLQAIVSAYLQHDTDVLLSTSSLQVDVQTRKLCQNGPNCMVVGPWKWLILCDRKSDTVGRLYCVGRDVKPYSLTCTPNIDILISMTLNFESHRNIEVWLLNLETLCKIDRYTVNTIMLSLSVIDFISLNCNVIVSTIASVICFFVGFTVFVTFCSLIFDQYCRKLTTATVHDANSTNVEKCCKKLFRCTNKGIYWFCCTWIIARSLITCQSFVNSSTEAESSCIYLLCFYPVCRKIVRAHCGAAILELKTLKPAQPIVFSFAKVNSSHNISSRIHSRIQYCRTN